MARKKTEKPDNIICRVKEYRLQKGWSQEELATGIDVRRQAIYDIESGRYLPNTLIALRLAKRFGCRVEDLFTEETAEENRPVHLVNDTGEPSARLALSRVRDRLVGLPLKGKESIPFGLRAADGLLNPDRKSTSLISSPEHLEKSVILMGCDPAFEILAAHVNRISPESKVHCCFASSHKALNGLAGGFAHIAGTHLHNTGAEESNVIEVKRTMTGQACRLFGFSVMEEGFMVAKGNPFGIKRVKDLARPDIAFVNREPGAALRILFDHHLEKENVEKKLINGYENEVKSHQEGAFRIVCDVADAALGLRAVAEAYGLDFVPVADARCDLVVPEDMSEHPTIKILLDVLQSSRLRREIQAVAGYESRLAGSLIAAV